MPEALTRHFGLISYVDDATLLFPEGLPAFEEAKRFILIDQPAISPIAFLQSLDVHELCFAVLPVLVADPDYTLQISADELEVLGLDTDRQPRIGEDAGCFAILSTTENCAPTANLLAPVVINLKSRIGLQSIRHDSLYSHMHELAKQGAACS